MQSIIFIILVGLIGGVAVGVQAPLSSLMSQRLGVLESIFIVHIGGALVALVLLLIFGSKFSLWRTVPWYAFGAGVFGLVVISAMSYMIPRAGVATSLIILLAGQLLIGTLLDHFGLLGAAQKPIDLTRVFGLSVVLAGVWLTVK
ncbi:MAG: DMT family transporter [Anaerolineales bacterium]|nr:DMT family transporter [Anaerolineales bacterium]